MPPKVSIITTVYDRVACLRRCIRTVEALNFKDYEHIVVSDCPPADIVSEIKGVVAGYNKVKYHNLETRHNNWGIAPAERGLHLATGKYLSFLSDDNGYLPNHFDNMVPELDSDPSLSFVYSACWYSDRGLFDCPVPHECKTDLGQPLFRRGLFEKLGNKLPFNVYGWDWKLIHAFMTFGKWKFINEPTFVFRLELYPQYVV